MYVPVAFYLVVSDGLAVAEAYAARNFNVEHVGELVPRVLVVDEGLSPIANLSGVCVLGGLCVQMKVKLRRPKHCCLPLP